MKKWLITFIIDSPLSNGYTIVFAKSAKEAELVVKNQSRFRESNYKIQSIEEYDYTGCLHGSIIAEGITLEGAIFTPHINKDGILSWTNNAGLKNPEPFMVKGNEGKLGPRGILGETGPRGLLGIKGDTGERGPSSVAILDSEENVPDDINLAVLSESTTPVKLVTEEDLDNYYTKDKLQFKYNRLTKVLNIIVEEDATV